MSNWQHIQYNQSPGDDGVRRQLAKGELKKEAGPAGQLFSHAIVPDPTVGATCCFRARCPGETTRRRAFQTIC
jgi:hypothetical protein